MISSDLWRLLFSCVCQYWIILFLSINFRYYCLWRCSPCVYASSFGMFGENSCVCHRYLPNWDTCRDTMQANRNIVILLPSTKKIEWFCCCSCMWLWFKEPLPLPTLLRPICICECRLFTVDTFFCVLSIIHDSFLILFFSYSSVCALLFGWLNFSLSFNSHLKVYFH